ncbi:hypothetical protein HMPREF1391_00987 [Helicobacter pylori GAM100Ai]|uniref:Uncharacterized protein n=1 Tax=Helicobacter pylori GAM100Ai TaxID=1159019 RepID=A0AB72ZUK0_HELPX|nr:hypothetical protein HMPREF1391_00987 [Helicobacter pylori GAM100Ai]
MTIFNDQFFITNFISIPFIQTARANELRAIMVGVGVVAFRAWGKSCMIIILIVVLALPCYLKQGYKTL